MERGGHDFGADAVTMGDGNGSGCGHNAETTTITRASKYSSFSGGVSLRLNWCLALGVSLQAQHAVWTGHYDLARTGANRNETVLNLSNVSPLTFGRVGKLLVSGCVAAQPLY